MKKQIQEVFEELKKDLEGYDLLDVADIAEISDQTIYNWMSGITESPRLINIIKVANAIGYDVELRLIR